MRVHQDGSENFALQARHANGRAIVEEALQVFEAIFLGDGDRMEMGRMFKSEPSSGATNRQNAQKRVDGRQDDENQRRGEKDDDADLPPRGRMNRGLVSQIS